jgi:hypothetical protein
MFSVPLIRHLLAGKGTKYCFVRGGQHLSLILQPFSPPNRGMEGTLIFLLEDSNVPENNFLLALSLRLWESTDIVGDVVRCLQLYIPYLSSTAEIVKTKLTWMPTQDLCQMFDAYSPSRYPHRLASLPPPKASSKPTSKEIPWNPSCCHVFFSASQWIVSSSAVAGAVRRELVVDLNSSSVGAAAGSAGLSRLERAEMLP